MDADAPAPASALQAPATAAVGRFVETIRRCCVDNRRGFWIHDKTVKSDADERRRCQHGPSRAPVGRQVNAGTEICVEVSFAASGIDPLRLARIKYHGADRERGHLIRARGPTRSGIL